MRPIAVLILLFGFLTGESQENQVTKMIFQKKMGQRSEQRFARAMVATHDNGYVVVGNGSDHGLDRVNHYGWLTKLDKRGQTLWKKRLNGLLYFYAVQETQDYGYIITGSEGVLEIHRSDFVVIKTTYHGDEEWRITLRGGYNNSDDVAASVIETSDHNYLVTGQLVNELSHLVLLKVDRNGKTIWKKLFTEYSAGVCLVETKDGGYLIGFEGDEQGNSGLLKTDSNGNQLWHKVLHHKNSKRNEITSLTLTDGGVIVAGATKLETSKVDGWFASGIAAWLIKTDSDGNQLWDTTFGGSGKDKFWCVNHTKDGSYILCGKSIALDHTSKAWLIKTDANGQKAWEKTFGGSKEEVNNYGEGDAAFCVLAADDGGYIFCGQTTGEIAVRIRYSKFNEINAWVVKTDENGNCLEAEK